MEEDATERIGGTCGVLKELFNIFFKQEIPDNQNYVKIVVGEALERKSNCHRILKLKVTEQLVSSLEIPLLRVNATKILRNLCSYNGSYCFDKLRDITTATPTILKAIMTAENKLQDVMIGLTSQVFRYMTSKESSTMFERTGIREAELARALVQILKKYPYQAV